MATKNDGGPAFPVPHAMEGYKGMTLRDWFAGQALAHIPALLEANERNKSFAMIAAWAYEVADAMLAAREAGK